MRGTISRRSLGAPRRSTQGSAPFQGVSSVEGPAGSFSSVSHAAPAAPPAARGGWGALAREMGQAGVFGTFDPGPWIELTEKGLDLTVKSVKAGQEISASLKKKKKAKQGRREAAPPPPPPPSALPGWLLPVGGSAAVLVVLVIVLRRRRAPVEAPRAA